MQGLQDFSLASEQKAVETDLKLLDQAQLLQKRAEIDSLLVGIRLDEIDLEKELLVQYQNAKVLQAEASKEKMTPMNQRAQVQNSLKSVLKELSQLQNSLHSSESVKRLKMALIRVVKQQPKEFQVAFFTLLETEMDTLAAEQAA